MRATAPLGEEPGEWRRATARPGLWGQWLVPGGPGGWGRGGAASPRVSGRCSAATRRGPRRPGRRGGRGCGCVRMGSIGLEQVAAFRALGEFSPHPSVTPYPPPGTRSGPQEAGALQGLLGAGPGEAGQEGGSEGSPAEQESRGVGPPTPGVAWAPRSTGLAPTQPPSSRRLGLPQGPGRLGGLPPPTSAPSAAPLQAPRLAV